MLIREFLHVEFNSAMKTVQIPTIFVKCVENLNHSNKFTINVS